MPKFNTGIELKLYAALKELDIPFEPQKQVLGICIPDAVVEPNIAIFADGDYWHSLPKSRRRDAYANKMLREAGWVVLRLKEHTINNAMATVKQTIVDTIKGIVYSASNN